VGVGLAINKSIELAALLNAGGWDAKKCAQWTSDYQVMLDRSLQAFDLWHSGEIFESDSAAREVAHFLLGSPFQVGIATHYSRALIDASSSAKRDRPLTIGESAAIEAQLRGLLPFDADGRLAGWQLLGVLPIPDGVQHRWAIDGAPELTALIHFSPVTQYYRRVGNISLSFMNLWDRPYPFDDRVKALFDALEAAVSAAPNRWQGLAQP
jgi:hypothetical protein